MYVDGAEDLALPVNVDTQVCDINDSAKDYGISLINGIEIIIMNMGYEPFTIHRGDRIAQLVFNEYKRVK